jgi:hypothetical protein
LLWESWRLTRVEMAFRLGLATIAGGAPLAVVRAASRFGEQDPANMARLADGAAVVTLFIIAFVPLPFWFSIAMLKGGRLIDGGMPGFPFSIGYPRPVSTGLLVGVPMTYFALAAAASYVVPAVVLGALFGYAFPLAPIAAWLVALSLVQAAANWWTRSKIIQLAGSIAATSACMWLASLPLDQMDREDLAGAASLPERLLAQLALSPGDYAVIASIAVASVALAIGSVARHRRGDTWFSSERAASAARSRAWRLDALRVPCPTATPARAQWWFEATRTGAPLIAVGLGLALAIPALLAGANAWEPAHTYALLFTTLTPAIVLRMGTDNVFGLRRKPGLTYASTFDTSQALGTTQLVAAKVFVRTACLLLALAVLVASVWLSVPLLNGWPAIKPWGDYDSLVGGQRAITASIGASTAPQRAALVVLIITGFAAMVAHAAALQALRLLHPMRIFAGVLAMLVYTLMFLFWSGDGVAELPRAIAQTYPWVIAAAIAVAAVCVFRLALLEQLVTPRHAAGAVLLWALCVVSSLALTPGGHVDLPAMTWTSLALMLSLNLLPATAVALTPWAYSLVRHR